MFFSFSIRRHGILGTGMRDPRDRRIHARTLSLDQLMCTSCSTPRILVIGALTGYDAHTALRAAGCRAGGVGSRANVQVNWKPIHFHGDLWAHGKAELSVFGFGLGLTVDARIGADVFDLFDLKGEFSVAINLPGLCRTLASRSSSSGDLSPIGRCRPAPAAGSGRSTSTFPTPACPCPCPEIRRRR